MLKISIDATFVSIDPEAYKDAAVQAMLYNHVEAARAFFIAAIPLVHIDTGMSIGGFIGLAQYLNENIERLGERRVYNPPKRYREPPPEFKSPESGALLGTERDNIFSVDYDKGRVRFQYHNRVWQFENYGGWGSIEAGERAFYAYLAAHPPKSPTLGKYLIKTYYRTTSEGAVRVSKVRLRRQRTLRPLADL